MSAHFVSTTAIVTCHRYRAVRITVARMVLCGHNKKQDVQVREPRSSVMAVHYHLMGSRTPFLTLSTVPLLGNDQVALQNTSQVATNNADHELCHDTIELQRSSKSICRFFLGGCVMFRFLHHGYGNGC